MCLAAEQQALVTLVYFLGHNLWDQHKVLQ